MVVADASGGVDVVFQLRCVVISLLLHDHRFDNTLGRLVTENSGGVGDRRRLLLIVDQLLLSRLRQRIVLVERVEHRGEDIQSR